MRHGLVISGLLSLLLTWGCGGATGNAGRPGKMPDGGTFTGVWFSPQYGEMHILQKGNAAVGRYEKGERRGKIQGNVVGDMLRFEWAEKREMVIGRPSETKGRGYFRIVKDERDDVFKLLGEWGHDRSESGGGPWNAVKSKKRTPEVYPSGGNPISDGDSGGDSGDEAETLDSDSTNPAVEDALGDI